MSKLIILRGNSGSGKSTIAKRLQNALGYGTMLIPQDVVRREIIHVKDEEGNPAVQLIEDLAMYGQKINYNVIIEGILVKHIYGTMLCRLIKNFPKTYAYYFDISFAETLKRHQSKANAHEFGEAEMRQWWVEKDMLGTEGEKVIGETPTENEIVDFILTGLKK